MKRIKEDLKNHSFHKVYLLYGEEDYLKRMYRDRLKEGALSGGDEMNYTRMEGNAIDFNDLRDIGNTLPFFSDYRVIVIEDSGLFKKSSELSGYLEEMPDTTIVVFVEKEVDKRNRLYKYVAKNGLAVEMKAMQEAELRSWVAHLLQKSHRKMREKTASYLLGQIENSMTNVENEIEKLVAYTEGREEITTQDIDAVCCIQLTNHIYQMVDAMAEKRAEKTLGLYHELLELRESPMRILYNMYHHFNTLLQVKELDGMGRDLIARKVSIFPSYVGKYQSQSRRFTEECLREMLDQCLEVEYQFKRGNLEDQIGVELLLVSFLKMS